MNEVIKSVTYHVKHPPSIIDKVKFTDKFSKIGIRILGPGENFAQCTILTRTNKNKTFISFIFSFDAANIKCIEIKNVNVKFHVIIDTVS